MATTFDAYYYAHGCGRPYQRDGLWLAQFGAVADRIVRDLEPQSVLDVGCAYGLLVETLRARGVDAYGIDVSEYAVSQAAPVVQPYVSVGSAVAPFGRTYALIVTIEVLEHLPPEQAEPAIANICRHTDDVLFSSSPLDYSEITHFNVQPPEIWARHFAHQGFYRDVDFDASFITPWAARFRRLSGPVANIVTAYERRFWQLQQASQARRQLNVQQRNELAQLEFNNRELAAEVAQLRAQVERLRSQNQELQADRINLQAIEYSFGGRMLRRAQGMRAALAPPHSMRDQVLDNVLQRFILRRKQIGPAQPGIPLTVTPIEPRAPLAPHTTVVDIVICVHNALHDVERCLESVATHTNAPYQLILIDDGSDGPTRDFLAHYAEAHAVTLVRNEQAGGYGRAAAQGLRTSTAPFALLLNSDTIVTSGWLDRMLACMESNPQIGLVGPLSNTASWQSIPLIEENGDWAANTLPAGVTIETMGEYVAAYSGRLYPEIPLLNGFCFFVRRKVVDAIGVFDEENFGAGYGEEDDFVLRARAAGWQAALADDAYVYHAQSKSYSHERRRQLAERAGKLLAAKHGQPVLDASVALAHHGRVFEGIRARARVMHERTRYLELGRERFGGRKVLFVLPVADPGGGGNVVIDEALAMQQMGVEVALFNSLEHRERFSRNFPSADLPVIYGEPADLGALGPAYDAVVATLNTSVTWLQNIRPQQGTPVLGYYVQDFEPYMYQAETPEYARALASYTLIPNLVRLTKTEWNRQEVRQQAGVDCVVVGPSANVDLFRPRTEGGAKPLRVAAMVRPASYYRSPWLTMELLRQMVARYGDAVEAVVFGVETNDPGFALLPQDFKFTLAGVINQRKVARLLSEVDIFVDFSTHQAMGLTAMEAMACGDAVIVPSVGGAGSFARHGQNCLMVNPQSQQDCWNALCRLIEDEPLRRSLQTRAIYDICECYVERPAFNFLSALFPAP